ncbi:MAG: type III pantothenate kinase [Planctomycetota bacterium]|nr:type III pantothenate kinase [Planctomycetota bacterium]
MIAKVEPTNPAEQLLVIDIGNTSIALGTWDHGEIRAAATVACSEFDSIREVITDYWKALGASKRIVACSVVPPRLEQLKTVAADVTGENVLVVGDELPAPIDAKIEKPESVGMDRLCCAAAAYATEGRACVVADLGTAITVDCVDDDGHFIGGAIFPGLGLQAGVLAERTALLPQIVVERPSGPLGQNTEQAIRSGIFYGSIGAIRRLVESYSDILGHWPALFLTGNDAPLVAESLEIADRLVPNLCLRGVALAYLKAYGALDSKS